MGEKPTEATCGNLGDIPEENPAGAPGASGFVTTKVAAEALGVNPRTIRTYIERGDLEAKVEGEGIQKMYLVSIDSLYALRDQRGYPRHSRGQTRDTTAAATEVPPGELADVIRDLTAELVQKAASEAELRTRLELTAQAESTVQAERERLLEDLARERARADRLEAELQEARTLALEPRDAPRDAPETASSEGSDEDSVPPEQPAQHRSWWRKFFGFE
jgi:hypothetical protein